jgi:hypothetical protein
MRPRSTFSPINSARQLSPHLQYADQAMTKAFINTMIKVLQEQHLRQPSLSNLSDQRYNNLRDNLILHNNAFHPHSLFKNVYKEPNGFGLVRSFLILLQELPEELSFLKITPANFFENRLRNILNLTFILSSLSSLRDKKLHDIMLGNSRYMEMPNDHQNLFIEILFNIKNKLKDDLEQLSQQINANNIAVLVTAKTIPERFGMTVDQAIAITQELDKALQAKSPLLMMNYLTEMVAYYQNILPPTQNAEAFKIILLEVKNKRSQVAFYNMQLGFPLGREVLRIILEKGFQPKLDRGLNVEEDHEPKYFITLIAKFYPEFSDARLTKASTIVAVNKLIPHISNSKDLIEEKLIQFEVLFALTKYYANTHTYPVIDDILGIDNTRTWQRLMSQIRSAAFAQLTVENNYRQPLEASHYLAVLKLAIKLPLFNQHRGNYSDFFSLGTKTSTVEKIEELIAQMARPREMLSYR